ncbi:MAG: GNAT family N-acetyltransferase [Rhodospirillaceae bacterium]|nr:GNAT family N-acetyltransferase [Rhodospirillaceae bacterium]|tara:strand:+ start:5215 stop:5766 length:552 start_codon:yes stop_codon:yes gene_type:complete
MAVAFPNTIETERLLLRRYRWSDIDDLMEYAVLKEWSRYIRAPYPYSRVNAQEFLADRVGLSRQDQTVWCLEYKGKMIGDVGFAWHTKNGAGEIAYGISPPYWKQGLMTEACLSALNTVFGVDEKLNRIFAAIDARNKGSIQVAGKLGMQREGLLRKNRFHKGEFVDDAWYAILRADWMALST